MANKLVTVGEGESAYQVVMDVEEDEATDDSGKVDRLPRDEAEKYTKAQLVDYVSQAEEDEDDSGGTEDA